MRVESKNHGFAVSSLIRERNPSGCHFWMSKPGSPVSVHYYRALKPCTGFQLVPFTIFRNDCVAVTLHSESPPSDRQQEPSCSLPSNTLLLHAASVLPTAFGSNQQPPPTCWKWADRKERALSQKSQKAPCHQEPILTCAMSHRCSYYESCHRDLELSSPSPLPCHIHKKPHCGLTLGVQWLSCHIIIFWFLTHLFWRERAFFSTFHSDERWIPPLVVPAQYNPQLIADHISASDQHFHLPKTITATQLPCSVRNKTENCHFL